MTEFTTNYFVDIEGNIYSKNKFKDITKLKLHLDAFGYLRVKVNNKTQKVHRIVANTFVDNPEAKAIVNHKNGIKNDNRACNLEWVTLSENTQHAYDTGLKSPYTGIKDKCNNKYYEEWLSLYNSGISMREIGKTYGVSHRTVGRTLDKFNNLKEV